MIVSKYGFADVLSLDHVGLDPSRIAAQVVTGVGFIGAGNILVRNQNIVGLTTAADIWVTAASVWLLAAVCTNWVFMVQ